jgi:hypothetical protein
MSSTQLDEYPHRHAHTCVTKPKNRRLSEPSPILNHFENTSNNEIFTPSGQPSISGAVAMVKPLHSLSFVCDLPEVTFSLGFNI